ncbi:cytochrome oxidase assembly protein [Natrarchaeobaculum aegyptiacum]|uniref:Cytochrome oxidase assembly protein n=1 Tax=Natrarchaeobaculum aegyptiacum TaxID=745377 RepID=A0A2Z2HZ28_9EURY|nr:cytochrome oxidase assembly protein [Natrarchaeobaculum aegyptiacum]ARS91157.1 cytochrome oxidase assembly protein [Natrarchaeobaculum aegyptiacum]
MSSDSHTRPIYRSLVDRFGFPHLLTTTLVLVAATILLGVAAKATGSGLACEANWPQCDAGPFNLFPANLPSFYEWIHRFVAMFAGFAIVGSALAAWRLEDVDDRVASLVILGMILTPIQVYLGGQTVLQYQMEILSLHFWTAILIFAMFVIATVLVWRGSFSVRTITGAFVVGLLTLPAHVALSPTEFGVVTDYSPTVQLLQYGVTLTLIGAVIVATMVTRWHAGSRLLSGLTYGTTGLALAVAYFGRQVVMNFSMTIDRLYLVLTGVLALAFVVAIAVSRRQSGGR